MARQGSQDFDGRFNGITEEGVTGLGVRFENGKKIDDLSIVEKVMKDHGIVMDPKKFRTLVGQQVSTFITDHVELGVPTPGLRQRLTMLGDTDPNTANGQFWRFVAQFKSFPITMLTTASRIGLSDPSKSAATLGAALNPFNQQKGDLWGLTQFMAGATVLGYMASATRDLLTGKEPRDPFDPATVAEAFVRGGSAGIYGDFLLGGYHKFSGGVLAALAGPVISDLGSAADMMSKLNDIAINERDPAKREKKLRKLGSRFFRLGIHNIPGQNLFWAKQGLDYLFMYNLNEQLNPGYLRRLERRVEEEPGVFNESRRFIGPRPTEFR